jgi:hypothetical protein
MKQPIAAVAVACVAVALVGAIALMSYLVAHRDPTSGPAQDTLAQYARSLPAGARVYWLPRGGLTTLPDKNLGQTDYVALMQTVQYRGSTVVVNVVTQLGQAGRKAWVVQREACCLPSNEVPIGRWSRPGDETVIVYAFSPPDRRGLREVVGQQPTAYK